MATNSAQNVYFFNPTNDLALATNGVSFTPPALLQKFELDLSVLPRFISSPSDVVIVSQLPPSLYEQSMNEHGFKSPSFVDRRSFFVEKWYEQNTIDELRPWGWSKSAHGLFDVCMPYVSDRFKNSCFGAWNDDLRSLCSRTSAQMVLKGICDAQIDGVVGPEAISEQIFSLEMLERHVAKGKQLVIKLPWSSSGRGLLVVHRDLFNASNKQWVSGGINSQGFVMLEPWFDRRADFSFLFECEQKSVKFKGVTAFETGSKGQFIGNYIHWPTGTKVGLEENLSEEKINQIAQILAKEIEKLPFIHLFQGRLGVDAMVIWHENRLMIHPCVEINFRATVGHIALEIRNLRENNYQAFLQIGYIQTYLQESKCANLLPITPIAKDTQFVAWLKTES